MREWNMNEDLIYYSHGWFFICVSYHQYTYRMFSPLSLSLSLYLFMFYVSTQLHKFITDLFWWWWTIWKLFLTLLFFACVLMFMFPHLTSPFSVVFFDTDNVFIFVFVCLLLSRLCIIVYCCCIVEN